MTIRIWVGAVPSSLCVNETRVREIFSRYGEIVDLSIHHDFMDMTAHGFIYITYKTKDEAIKAIQAVESGDMESGDSDCTQLKAKLALNRGAAVTTYDTEIADLLLGKRQATIANPFSQHSMGGSAEDEDDNLILQSLSQQRSSTSQSTPRKSSKKKRDKLMG